MTISYTITYATGYTSLNYTEAHLPIILDHVDEKLYGKHDNKRIEYITIFYQNEDRDDFLLDCSTPDKVTPAIDHVRTTTTITVPSPQHTSVAQSLAVSWKQCSESNFRILFSEFGMGLGSVTVEFNPGDKTPPLKLKVVVKREPGKREPA